MPSLINQNWVFGTHARLSFSTPNPTASAGTAIATEEGCASISDASGTLLMYTDGSTVWDAGGTIRASNLGGSSTATQSAIIVPDPGAAGAYYVFTVGGSGTGSSVKAIRIDVQTWNQVPVTTQPLPPNFLQTEKLTAIQLANCRDYWVLTALRRVNPSGLVSGAGLFRVYLVNAGGVQYVSDTPIGAAINDLGYLRGSSDGKRLAFANWYDRNAMVCPFDSATGAADFSQLVTFQAPTPVPGHGRQVYGVEFSPKVQFLYYSLLGGYNGTGPTNAGYVYQQDLLNPTSAPVQLGVHPNLGTTPHYALGALQLGPDNRIYIAQDAEAALGVIAAPDSAGAACNLSFSAVPLAGGTLSHLGLPNLIPNACGCACEEGNCDEAVDRANWLLNAKANQKSFTVPANGQSAPAGCGLAFEQHSFPPFFTLHWGDGASDQFESDDTEVIYIRVHNPFRNLVYRGLKIFNIRVNPNQLLPDGDETLRLIPSEIVCFEQIDPCAHVSRDFAFLIVHALVGGYQITFDYCIDEIAIVGASDGHAAFDVQVVAS